jgi:hypothetical protein
MPIVSLSDFDAAYKLQNLTKTGQKVVKTYKGCYFFAASDNMDQVTHEDLKKWYELYVENTLTSWEEFFNNRFKWHCVKPTDALFKCSCMVGCKKVACKHSVMVMCHAKKLVYPESTTSRNLEVPRKRGRPAKLKGPKQHQ